MYLSDSVKMKKSQLEGDDDMLDGVYYYNPSISSIQKYSNILRTDLGLSKITDKDDFLNQRVIDHYGSLVPLTELDDSLLRKGQNDTTDDKKDKDNDDSSNDNNNDDQQNSGTNNQTQNNQQTDNQNNGMNTQQDNTVNNQNYQQQQQDTTAY